MWGQRLELGHGAVPCNRGDPEGPRNRHRPCPDLHRGHQHQHQRATSSGLCVTEGRQVRECRVPGLKGCPGRWQSWQCVGLTWLHPAVESLLLMETERALGAVSSGLYLSQPWSLEPQYPRGSQPAAVTVCPLVCSSVHDAAAARDPWCCFYPGLRDSPG